MSRWQRAWPGGLCVVWTYAACSPTGAPEAPETDCVVVEHSVSLPDGLGEVSGLAAGRRTPGLLWVHNDSGDDPVVYAVSAAGELRGRVQVEGAEHRDWEDIGAGPCPQGDCLYIGDIGDNAGVRDAVDVYRVPEPSPGSTRTEPAERFRYRYPGGARDAEALFVLPSQEVFIVTKGTGAPVELFRYPPPLRAGETVTLEKVATLGSTADGELLRITGAAASPSGQWVAIRAYRRLMLYRTDRLVAGDLEPALEVDLTPVGEGQGEAVALGDDGAVVLGSEGPSRSTPGTLARLDCRLPE